jgi:Organic solute transport protein 1
MLIKEKDGVLNCRRVMKAMFEKLAHASIMRLNPASMDKLYDLMTMAVKHQVSLGHI